MQGSPYLLPCRRYHVTPHHNVSLALQVAINYEPLAEGFTIWVTLCSIYLAIFVLYWLYCLVRPQSAAHSIVHLSRSAACVLSSGPLQGSAAL